jgi:ABC-type sugar transport system substrate-binding protein
METPGGKVAVLSLPAAADVVEDLRSGRDGGVDHPSAVVVAGADAAAVGEAVTALRAAGMPSAGWVGDPTDPAVREMAAELFPGAEIEATTT